MKKGMGLIDSFRLLQLEVDMVDVELAVIRADFDLALGITRHELARGTIDDKYPSMSR